mgnify:CR=1 FL=1
MRILIVRLGAMGDVIHALPAAAALRLRFPDAHISWAIEPRWAPLLQHNPHLNEIVPLNRKQWNSIKAAWKQLRAHPYDLAFDFQGLIKSALTAFASRAKHITGYHRSQLREWPAAFFYTETVHATAPHIVDQHLELAGAPHTPAQFHIPPGKPEGALPDGPFVLASPIAGWPSKEWPLDRYSELARLLPMPLVLNGHPAAEPRLRAIPGTQTHISSIDGLIDATRRARAVVGVDSGPLHLAAALNKPGVAIYGPTDPARNGPYGPSIRVLRHPQAITSYKRRDTTDSSMLAITPTMVARELEAVLQ